MAPPYRVWTGSGSSWRRRIPPEEKVGDVPACPLLCLPRIRGLMGPGDPLPWRGSAPARRLRALGGPSPGPWAGARGRASLWSHAPPGEPSHPRACLLRGRPRLDTSTRASSVLRGFRSLCTRGTGSRGISWRLRSHCAPCVDRALPHATSATSSLGTWVPQSAPGLRAGSMTAGAQPGPLSPGDLQAEGRRVCISWRELSRTTYWSPGRGGSSVRSRLRHSDAWIPPGLWRTWFPRAGSAPSVSVLSGDRPWWPRWWPLCLGAPVPASPPWA